MDNRKMLVFTDWPLTQWNVEWYEYLMKMSFMSWAVGHTTRPSGGLGSPRSLPSSTRSAYRVTSCGISSTGYNMQHDCADMIFVNEWNNGFGVLLREMEKLTCKTYTGPKTGARGSRAKRETETDPLSSYTARSQTISLQDDRNLRHHTRL